MKKRYKVRANIPPGINAQVERRRMTTSYETLDLIVRLKPDRTVEVSAAGGDEALCFVIAEGTYSWVAVI